MGSSQSKNQMKSNLPQLNISVIGPMGSGKTQLIQRICHDKISSDFIDCQTFSKKIVSKKMELVFTDSPGSFELRDSLPFFIKGADVVILVYSVKNDPNDLVRFFESVEKQNKFCRKVLVCNKIDLDDFIIQFIKRIEELKDQFGYEMIFVSAKENKNVQNIVNTLILK